MATIYEMQKRKGSQYINVGVQVSSLEEAVALSTKKGWAWEIKDTDQAPESKELSGNDIDCYRDAQRLFKIAYNQGYNKGWVFHKLSESFHELTIKQVLTRSALEFDSLFNNGYATASACF